MSAAPVPPGNSPAKRPSIMGILNATPDSFSDGGRFNAIEAGISRGLELLAQGADLLDIGGESTRPGAAPVPADEEIARVVPIIEGVVRRAPRAVISIDTHKAAVARAALDAGAAWVNDVTALGDPHMAEVCAAAGCPVVLMHMRGTPRTMQRDTAYDDLLAEVEAFLAARTQTAIEAGIAPERIVVDPGIGFGKAPADNLRLFHLVPRLRSTGQRVLVGASRKRFIGELTGVQTPAERAFGSVGAALAAAHLGASVLRVHDVPETVQALTVFQAIEAAT